MSMSDNFWKIERFSDTRAEWKIASAKYSKLNKQCERARRLSDALYAQMETLRKECEAAS